MKILEMFVSGIAFAFGAALLNWVQSAIAARHLKKIVRSGSKDSDHRMKLSHGRENQ